MSRHLQAPHGRDWARVKKVSRYLQYTKGTEVNFIVGASKTATLRFYTDSDHAGDKETRKSSTCVVGFLGNCVLSGMSKTQSTIATSSGEAELYALVTGCGEGLQAQGLLEELGIFLKLGLYTDSSTAKKVAQRRGPGAMKHLEVKYLFLQDVTAKKRAFVHKVATADNPADLGTKWHGTQRLDYLRGLVGMKLPTCANANQEWQVNAIENKMYHSDNKYQRSKQHHTHAEYYKCERSGAGSAKPGGCRSFSGRAGRQKKKRQRWNQFRQLVRDLPSQAAVGVSLAAPAGRRRRGRGGTSFGN